MEQRGTLESACWKEVKTSRTYMMRFKEDVDDWAGLLVALVTVAGGRIFDKNGLILFEMFMSNLHLLVYIIITINIII